jgi:Tol biopolymer transport system component
MALSPDDPTLMLTELDLGSLTGDIWSYELDSGRRAPLTFEGHNYSPVFTQDGGYLVFGHADSISGGRPRLLALPTDRSDQQATTLLELDTGAIFPASIHPSEPVLVGTLGNTRTGANSVNGDIFLFTLPEDLSVDSDATEPDLVVLATEFDERQPTFSPDGRWIAYSSNESGRHEIYVIPYPGQGRKEQVSVSGGTAPRWSPAGNELYFIADDALMAAGVETVEAGNRFRAGTPEVVLEDPRIVDESVGLTPASPTYTTTSDGSRLLILSPGSANASSTVRLNVVQNWYEELRELAPFPAGWE